MENEPTANDVNGKLEIAKRTLIVNEDGSRSQRIEQIAIASNERHWEKGKLLRIW